MQTGKRYYGILLFIIAFHSILRAQDCGKFSIIQQSQIAGSCNAITLTMLHDQQNRPYLYVANKEAGLKFMILQI
ncbi:MAG: hypothetical protein IPP43_00630 [Chitinophagaceae bacterium]|nr:hypothetical protein [Chitinophagaceae bacterium]